MLVRGVAEPLEDHGLGVGEDDARGAEAVEGVGIVRRGAGADRVGNDEDVTAGGGQIESRLEHADMGLHAGEHDLRPGEREGAAGRKGRLLDAGRAAGSLAARSGTVGPRPFGYCSVSITGTERRDAASRRRAVLRRTASRSGITAARRSWMSMTTRVESGARRRAGAGILSMVVRARSSFRRPRYGSPGVGETPGFSC